MNHKMFFKRLGAATVIAAFGFVACNDDTSSGPNTSDEITSSESSGQDTRFDGEASSSSDAIAPSSSEDAIPSSSESPTSSAEVETANSSSSLIAESSSSLALSSSATAESSSAVFKEECIDFARMCRNCDGPDCPIPFRPCSECFDEGMMAEDCVTGGVYKCENRLWNLADRSQCLNVALTPCTGDSANCGRVPCNSNAPKTVIDCESGEEYVCADAYWTPMKETESCTRIVGAENGYEGEQCTREEVGKRTVDCARNVEYECLSAGFWQQINPTIGDTCLVDGSILEGYVETAGGARNHTIFMCYEGKWEKYRGTYESMSCVDAAVVRTPCDAEKEWIHQGDCDYQCHNGEYVFVPKLADE